jgi:group I intron endonuclease
MNSRDSGIYSITSKVSGKRYIGSSIRICDRWNRHLRDLKANKHHSLMLQRHFNKYGEDDLLFAVVEIVDRGELSLQDFKQLLLDREQSYLDNWSECPFNCLPTAGSPLGYKQEGAKYYAYDRRIQQYITRFAVNSKQIKFGNHYTEEEAIKEVEYLRTLTDEELLDYKQECLAKSKRPKRDAKNYYFDKLSGKYLVRFMINGKSKYFGLYTTEQEAIDKVIEVKQLLF